MSEPHMKIEDMPEYKRAVTDWLKERYGAQQGNEIWKVTCRQYEAYLPELPDYGGKKNSHALAIYGALIIFSMYPQLPDQPPIEELQQFVQDMFMEPMVKMGKVINLNRRFDLRLINFIFQKVGKKDRDQMKLHPATFDNISEPYDKKHHAARYHFNQCPNAEFAKEHNLLHVLPLFCNSDYYGIAGLHGTLIREGTCGNADKCDYCIVGSENPLAAEYEIVRDENGFLISKRKR